MATWRCPGCGTVQLENAECFVCGRSATSCATCANFRRSVAAGIGYCALDRGREPLTGAEQRPCWTSAVGATGEGLFSIVAKTEVPAPPRGLLEKQAREGRPALR
jgi:hypothetical protein